MTKLLIFPFNGNGLEALDCLGNNFEFLGFIDDTMAKQGENKLGFHVFTRDAIEKYPDAKILAVPGSHTSFLERRDIIDSLNIPEKRFASVIHPSAKVSSLSKIGSNVLIMAGTVITSNAVVGNHVCILPNSVIHHDTQIGNYTLIGSGVTIAGNSKIGSNCYIGSGSSVSNNIEIGANSLIGIGANVIRPFPENAKIVGNPARQI